MVNDEQFTTVKLRKEIAAELDKIIDQNQFLRTRPAVIKYILHRYVEDITGGNGGNGGIHYSNLSTNNKVENKKHERNHKNANE